MALIREGVLSAVVVLMCWAEGADSPEGGVLSHHQGVEEESVVVAEDRAHCGPVRNLGQAYLVFIGYYSLRSVLLYLCSNDVVCFRLWFLSSKDGHVLTREFWLVRLDSERNG